MTDPDELTAVIGRVQPTYVVVDTNAVAIDALTAAAESGSTQVVPSVRATRLSLDREGMRRLAADELGLPTAPFWFAGSVAELTAIAGHAGFPLVVKPVIGVPGEGQSVLLRPEDVEPAWQRAVAAGGRESIRLYDTSTWLDTLTLEGAKDSLWPTMISPDGNVIGAGSLDGGRLQLWRAPSWEEIAAAEAKEKMEGKLP